MTNGKTTLEFQHGSVFAVDAARDALTLAIAWEQDGKRKAKLETIQDDLNDLFKQMTRGASIDQILRVYNRVVCCWCRQQHETDLKTRPFGSGDRRSRKEPHVTEVAT